MSQIRPRKTVCIQLKTTFSKTPKNLIWCRRSPMIKRWRRSVWMQGNRKNWSRRSRKSRRSSHFPQIRRRWRKRLSDEKTNWKARTPVRAKQLQLMIKWLTRECLTHPLSPPSNVCSRSWSVKCRSIKLWLGNKTNLVIRRKERRARSFFRKWSSKIYKICSRWSKSTLRSVSVDTSQLKCLTSKVCIMMLRESWAHSPKSFWSESRS